MKQKSIVSLFLCLILLFTEVFPVYAASQAEGTSLPGLLSESEDISGEEASLPLVITFADGKSRAYDPNELEFGPLEGTDGAVVYKSAGVFALTKNFSASLQFGGGINCSFDLAGHTLTGVHNYTAVKVRGKKSVVTILSAPSSGQAGVITTSRTEVEDSGAMLSNMGSLTLKNIQLKGAGSGTAALHNGGAVMNGGQLTLVGVTISGFTSRELGGGIYNSETGTLKIGDGTSTEKLTVSGCSDSQGKNSIYNDASNERAGKIELAGAASLSDPVRNAGTITGTVLSNESFYLDGNVVNTNIGTVESGIFNGTVTGGKVKTESGNVKLRLILSVDGKNSAVVMPAGALILSELQNKGIFLSNPVFPNDGRRAVTQSDKAEIATMKTRTIEAKAGTSVKVDFETNFETKLPSQIIEKGTTVQKPAITREGYLDAIWCTDAALTKEFSFSTKINQNLTLYARWVPKSVVPVVVTFDAEGGTAVDSQTLMPGSAATKPVDPIREGYAFQGWYTDKTHTRAFDFTAAVNASMTLYAFWKAMPDVVVTYEYGYGIVKRMQTKYNAPAVCPPDPEERKDATFTGWYADKEKKTSWNFNTRVIENRTIWAGWKEKTKYTVSFDSKGGSAVTAQTVYTGSKAAKPADPTKELHRFCGWCTDASCTKLYDFNTPVTRSFTLYAKWLENPVVPVKVTFESNGGSSVPGQVLAAGLEKAVRPEDPVRQYHRFTGWYSDKGLIKSYDFSQIVNNDLTLYAAWELAPVVPVYVTFDYNGEGTSVTKMIFQYEPVEEPTAPISKTKYFIGWYADKACTKLWDFSAKVASDMTLYAGWKDKPKHMVFFDSMGGSHVSSKAVLETDPVAKPSPDPVRDGYIFCGWCTDETAKLSYDFALPVMESFSLYARWLQKGIVAATVSFETNGGSKIEAQILQSGVDKAKKPADPVKELHSFAGWYSDKALTKPYDFDSIVNDNITLYAKWLLNPVSVVHVTFERQDGTVPTVTTVQAGDSVPEPERPVRTTHFFIGWYEDKECTRLWDFSRGVYEDRTIYAGWLEKQEFVVTFYLYDSKTETQKVLQLDPVKKPKDPSRTNYKFIGWSRQSSGRELYDFDTPVAGDMTLYAIWLEEAVIPARIYFDSNGGSAVPEQVVVKGKDKAVKPKDPIRTSYVFTGWYEDAALTRKYNFDQIVTRDLTLYADWNLQPAVAVKVSFDLGDGTIYAMKTVLQGDKVPEPSAPIRETEFFAGWYVDKSLRELWKFDVPVTENMTLYARWIKKKELTVTFDSNGGSSVPEAKVLEEDKVEKPSPDPVREDYVFICWCTDKEGRNTYNFDDLVFEDMTLYARWLQKAVVAVRVSFDSTGGSEVPTEVIARGDKVAKPEDPVREYYSFAGWYLDPALTEKYDFDMKVMDDMTLYASWLFSPVTTLHVTFKYQDDVTPDKIETVLYADPVPKPADPLRDAFFFTGWYEDAGCSRPWIFTTAVMEEMTLYAGWREKEVYTVKFDLNGGSGSISDQKVLELTRATKPSTDPTKAGYKFWGWTTEKDGSYKFNFDAPIFENITLYAKWYEPSVIPLIVEFDSDGGSIVHSQFVASGSNATRPENPTKKGFSFVAWIKELTGEVFDFAEILVNNLRLKAKWLQDPVYVLWLRFDSRGGSRLNPQMVEKGGKAVWPDTNPTREGYHFSGWYGDPDCTVIYDFDTVLEADRIVYAGWQKYLDCTVRFESNGGSGVEDQLVKEGECAVKPSDPYRENFDFLFWCEDAEFTQVYDFGQPVIRDRTLYARWVPRYVEKVTVHFEANGGTAVEDQVIAKGQKASKPADPIRSSYRFNGWFTDTGCSRVFDFDTAVNENLTLYAGWTYTGGGGGGGSSSGGSTAALSTYDAYDASGKKIGTWAKNEQGWWIARTDGTWPRQEWVQCTWNGVLNWYYFTPEGYMLTGFMKNTDGKTYYLHNAATGSAGAMATGWVQIEGKWYYFNTISDGTKGAMLVNTVTPDGYKVGADGVWIREE